MEIRNTEIFRADFKTFRRDRHAFGKGVFICVKNNIACSELWVDDEFEILAVTLNALGNSQAFTEPQMRTYGLLQFWLPEPVFW